MKHRPLRTESDVHGPKWNEIHGGYFSDPDIADVLLRCIEELIRTSRPEIIVDLGGGTGFLLDRLISRDTAPERKFVNVDISQRQLDTLCNRRIVPVHKSLLSFSRKDAGGQKTRMLFMMRSAIHYFGISALGGLLRHLHSLMSEGEFFIHQTACFEKASDAACLNLLYEHMGTGKWFPTVDDLCVRLTTAGWEVLSSTPAPMLTLLSSDLALRYRIDKMRLSQIGADISRRFGKQQDFFESTESGFRAVLDYRIFVCRTMPVPAASR